MITALTENRVKQFQDRVHGSCFDDRFLMPLSMKFNLGHNRIAESFLSGVSIITEEQVILQHNVHQTIYDYDYSTPCISSVGTKTVFSVQALSKDITETTGT